MGNWKGGRTEALARQLIAHSRSIKYQDPEADHSKAKIDRSSRLLRRGIKYPVSRIAIEQIEQVSAIELGFPDAVHYNLKV